MVVLPALAVATETGAVPATFIKFSGNSHAASPPAVEDINILPTAGVPDDIVKGALMVTAPVPVPPKVSLFVFDAVTVVALLNVPPNSNAVPLRVKPLVPV